jgi:hypothetical protein
MCVELRGIGHQGKRSHTTGEELSTGLGLPGGAPGTGDKKLKAEESCRDQPYLPISSAWRPFYQMLCYLTRVVIACRPPMISFGIETANPSGSHLSYILYLGAL